MAEENKKVTYTKEDIDKNKTMAIFAYLGILILIPFLTEAKNSPFVKFHIKQGLLLIISFFVVGFAAAIPFIGWFLISWIGPIFCFILLVIGIINCVNGEAKPLPLIGKYAEEWFKF